MSPRLGTINYHNDEGYQKSYSDKTNLIIDEEVKNLIDDCYTRCKNVLSQKKDLIKALAEALLTKETLSLPEIVDILGPRPFPLKANI